MRIFFVLLTFVYLVQSSPVAGSVNDASPSDNVIDSDLSTSKSSRIVNQSPNALFDPESKSLTPANAAIFKIMLLPTLTFIVSTLVKSKLAVAHLLFGALFGIVATVATCNFTPICRITAGSEAVIFFSIVVIVNFKSVLHNFFFI